MTITAIPDATWQRFHTQFRRPWVKDGWRYATDGRAILALHTHEPDTQQEERVPTVEKIVDVSGLACVPVPDFQASRGGTCPECKSRELPGRILAGDDAICSDCNGTGKEECDECEGLGVTECCRCSSEVDCEECDGIGKVECSACDGGVAVMKPCPTCGHLGVNDRMFALRDPASGVVIDSWYFDPIKDMPGLVMHEVQHHAGPVKFSFNGGRAVIMPITY